MSVPADAMPPANQAPMPGGPSPVDNAPGAAPMMTPQEPAGDKAGAKVDVLMAIKMLEKALAAFGSMTEEGKAVLTAIKGLGSKFGAEEESSQQLMPAEIQQLLQGVAGPGAPPPPPPGAPPGMA